MKSFSRICTVALSLLISSLAYAAPPNWRDVDVLPFDVAGLKLGMGYQETLAIIGKHFKLSAAEVSHVKKLTLTDYSKITKNKEPLSIFYKNGNTLLEVTFSVRLPVNKSDSVAINRIHYGLPPTKENASSLKEAALSKYGRPSDDRRQANLMWCAHYNQITQCELSKPKLSLSLGSLVLEDPSLDEAVKQYEQKMLKASPNI